MMMLDVPIASLLSMLLLRKAHASGAYIAIAFLSRQQHISRPVSLTPPPIADDNAAR